VLLNIEEDTQKYILKRITKFYDYNKKEDYEAIGYVRSNF